MNRNRTLIQLLIDTSYGQAKFCKMATE